MGGTKIEIPKKLNLWGEIRKNQRLTQLIFTIYR